MIRKTSPVIVRYRYSHRWEWCVPFPMDGGELRSTCTFPSKLSALRAGRRAWAKIVTRMQQGDMP